MFKTVKVGALSDIIGVDFDEEVVVLKSAKPVDPAYLDLLAEVRVVGHYYLGIIQIFK